MTDLSNLAVLTWHIVRLAYCFSQCLSFKINSDKLCI